MDQTACESTNIVTLLRWLAHDSLTESFIESIAFKHLLTNAWLGSAICIVYYLWFEYWHVVSMLYMTYVSNIYFYLPVSFIYLFQWNVYQEIEICFLNTFKLFILTRSPKITISTRDWTMCYFPKYARFCCWIIFRLLKLTTNTHKCKCNFIRSPFIWFIYLLYENQNICYEVTVYNKHY